MFFFAENPYLRRSAKNGGQRNAARIRRSPAIIPGRRDNDAAGMSERRLRASGAKYDGQLRGGAFVPAIGVNDVAVFIGPGDLLVAQLYLFQMVVLLVGGVFDVVHQGIHFHHLDVLKFGIAQFSQINPPQRLLMGPGPINADPRVLRAMSSQLVGQYDPAMTHYMNEVMALYRGVFRTENRWTMLVDGTSRAGIEAILVSAIRPGDKVLVPVFGRFGHLLCEIARRCRAEVHTIEVPWGEVFKPDQVEDAIKRVRPRLLLTVQGDTSTTMLQPLAELGEICRRHDVLFYTDATASLGGNPLETDAWQLDAVSAGMQKCLGGPSGTSPITLSPRMEEVIRRRRCIEQGIRTDAHHDGLAYPDLIIA